jgi:superfamily II RNA helicase
LISSRLPDLNGHFPITTTLVLRLFTLLHESRNAQYAVSAIRSLLSQPRLYLDGLDFKHQVLHHLRFSIEYLRRQSLLSAQGAPINLAGLTSHLYYTENSSFAFNALFKGGFFHELCSAIDEKESNVLRTLMIVMAHIFGRRPCKQADQEYIDRIVKRSPSIVFLPPLPSSAAAILRRHNQDTLEVFTTYVRTFVAQHMQTEDCMLPLTRTTFGANATSIDLVPGDFPRTKVRSAFVALSGHGDSFDSISDLCSTVRQGVFLEEAVIPHLTVYPEEDKRPLNACK